MNCMHDVFFRNKYILYAVKLLKYINIRLFYIRTSSFCMYTHIDSASSILAGIRWVYLTTDIRHASSCEITKAVLKINTKMILTLAEQCQPSIQPCNVPRQVRLGATSMHIPVSIPTVALFLLTCECQAACLYKNSGYHSCHKTNAIGIYILTLSPSIWLIRIYKDMNTEEDRFSSCTVFSSKWSS